MEMEEWKQVEEMEHKWTDNETFNRRALAGFAFG